MTRDDLHEDVVNKGEEELLDEVPDHGSEEVEDVVDGLAEVSLPEQAVEVHLDLGERGGDVHLGHLGGDKVSYFQMKFRRTHLNESLGVDQDSSLGEEVKAVNLKIFFL